ncbi:hypothetical protein ACH5RR_002063 [Cinchona calisaya]|uniref:Uncharacterized protein n=1 Tax=Cinchona calisaya TaxID=153742 RepID=A0ABD3B565_9GENT
MIWLACLRMQWVVEESFPKPSNIPNSYDEANKMTEDLGFTYPRIELIFYQELDDRSLGDNRCSGWVRQEVEETTVANKDIAVDSVGIEDLEEDPCFFFFIYLFLISLVEVT